MTFPTPFLKKRGQVDGTGERIFDEERVCKKKADPA
jgi:hypothetical protein